MKTSLLVGGAFSLLLIASSASAATTTLHVTMNGAQETPPLTTGTATGGPSTVTFDDGTGKFTGTVSYTGLTGAPQQAHVHIGAACGAAAGEIKAISTSGLAAAGNLDLSTVDAITDSGDITNIKTGMAYVNIHTTANPNGELRGQLIPDGADAGCATAASSSGGTSGTSGGTSGTSGGTSGTSGGTSGTSGTAGSSGSNGATTTPADGGTAAAPSSSDDSGCSTTGSGGSGGALALAFGVGIAIAAVTRNRRKRA